MGDVHKASPFLYPNRNSFDSHPILLQNNRILSYSRYQEIIIPWIQHFNFFPFLSNT